MPFKKLKAESEELGIPFWRMPDFVLVFMAIINTFVMIVTYAWASNMVEDPREAVLLVAAMAALIMVVGNIMTESAKHIVRTNKLKKEFIQIISHQMRTPLTMIKWNVEKTIKLGNISTQQLDLLHKIEEENEKLKMMVNDVLNMSRIEEKKSKIKIDRIDIVSKVKECIDALQDYADAKKVQIHLECEQNPFFVNADVNKVGMVLMNIIENAIKYNRERGRVDITIQKDGEKAKISVKDQGIGIDTKEQGHVFEKFYRAKGARKKEPQGTGLGLFITKSAIEQMNGQVELESRPNEGATFTFWLKAKK